MDGQRKLTLSTDFQYVDATTTGTRYILSTGQSTSPQFNVDFRGDLPRLSVTDSSGAEGYLADVNNYDGWRYHLDNKDDNKGTEFAWRADMDLAFDSDFVRSFKAGVRYTDRDAETKGNIYRFMCINNCAGAPFSQFPSVGVVTNPITDFFRGEGHAFGPTLTASDAAVANYQQTLATFGASPLEFSRTTSMRRPRRPTQPTAYCASAWTAIRSRSTAISACAWCGPRSVPPVCVPAPMARVVA